MTRHPRALAISAITLTLLATAACGNAGAPPDAPATAHQPTAGNTPNTVAPPTIQASTAEAPPAPTYPSTAEAYAQEILAAWKNDPTGRSGDVTTAEVHEQILEIPGPTNQAWRYGRCDGAAGNSYCTFFNDVGDMITLKVTSQYLGQPHAGAGVVFDQVTFPTNPIAYVEEFVGGWQQGNVYRMKILSNAAEVDYFTHYPPPDPFSTCLNFVSAVPYVLVHNSNGLKYGIEVAGTLGKSHAITGHVNAGLLGCS